MPFEPDLLDDLGPIQSPPPRPKPKGDCGCGGGKAGGAFPFGTSASPPAAVQLERELAALMRGGTESRADALEFAALDLEDVDTGLADELGLGRDADDAPDLAELLALLERYPGLKITLSY